LHLKKRFQTIEMPLLGVLAEMEWKGIRIEGSFFRQLENKLAVELRALEIEIHKEAGVEFNITSNPQLREILFERLGLPVVKRTKTGPSTDASVLEVLAAQGH